MQFRHHHTQLIAAAKAGISERTARRIERDPRSPSQKRQERKQRRQVPDPLEGLWESDILPLLAPDEGRNAEVAREMKESGAWLVPTYNGADYLDKPAFFFKTVALSLAMFGKSEAVARLPSAVAAAALVVMVFAFCRKIHGTRCALLSVIVVVSWEWLPFAILIFVTALQSLDREQLEAARMDGARGLAIFRYLTLPHLARPIAVVVMVEAIFLLNVFAEIFVTTNGGPGDATTNIPYLVYTQALLEFDVGAASAGGLVAVVLANIMAVFLIRLIGKSLTER